MVNSRTTPLPACYSEQRIDYSMFPGKLQSMSDETLFYIFYQFPGDALQANAATVLYVFVFLSTALLLP